MQEQRIPPSTARIPTQPKGPPPRKKGLVHSLLYYRNFAGNPFEFVESRFRQYGDIYRADSPDGTPLYVLRKAEHCREVLATKNSKYRKQHSAFERLSEVLGNGLLTSDGEDWKRQRRLVQPAFHAKRLEEYSEAIVDEARRSAAAWRHGAVTDVARDMMQLTMRVVARTLFSYDVEQQSARVGEAMMQMQDSFASPAQFLPEWMPIPARQRGKRALAELDSVIYSLINERRRQGAAGAKPDLLQALIDAVDEDGDGGTLSETELRDQLMTLFLAGHETTSNALSWVLYLLSENPACHRLLREEVDSVLGNRPASFADLERMPYGEQVIMEAMRLYPPVSALARKAHEDTEIGPYNVAAGSEVIMWIYFTHRDPSVYPQPAAFRPERFTKEARESLPKMAYLPFGGGPRLCVGHAFAMLEARLILATLVQAVDMQMVPGQRIEPKLQITLAPKNGLKMRVKRRQRPAAP